MPRVLWIGLVAGAVYVLIAAGGGLLLDALMGPRPDPVVELAVSHLVPLPVGIAAGLAFARWSGWWPDVWRLPSSTRSRPRRWWLILVPAGLCAQIAALFIQAPWASLSAAFVLVGLACYLLVGFGEELFFRGLLRASVRSHHGETVTLLVTSLAFGLAHSFGSALSGVPLGAIAFQVGVTAMDGALLYAVLRVTGTLWAPIALHGLGDFGRWVAAGDGADHTTGFDGPIQIVLIALAVALFVSVVREDRRARVAAPDAA